MWCLSWSPVQSWYVASTRKSRLLPRMRPADLSACDSQEIVWPSSRFCKLNLNGDFCRMFAYQKGRHKEGWTITTVTGRCATLPRRHLFFQRSLFPWQGTGCIDAATSTPHTHKFRNRSIDHMFRLYHHASFYLYVRPPSYHAPTFRMSHLHAACLTVMSLRDVVGLFGRKAFQGLPMISVFPFFLSEVTTACNWSRLPTCRRAPPQHLCQVLHIRRRTGC